jgi:PAS domain S-box-containing protein
MPRSTSPPPISTPVPASDALVLVGAHGRIEAIDGAAAALVGVDDESVVGEPLATLVASEHRGVVEGALAVSQRRGERTSVEARLAPSDAPCELAIAPLGTKLVVRLLPPRMTTGPQLRVRRRRAGEGDASFRSLIEVAPDAVAVHRDGVLVYVNGAAVRLLGCESPSDLVGVQLLDLVAEEDRARMRPSPADVNATFERSEVRLLRRDGGSRTVDVRAIPVEFEGDAAALVVARDVTDRAQMLAKLQQSDRMVSVGTLAAGVAHEINNPLAYILANVSFALERIEGRSDLGEIAECLAEAREGAERVRDIVRDLKTVSRQDDGERLPIDVRKIVQSAVRMARGEMRQRAQVVLQLDEVPAVYANESRLAQVVLNLLVNAAQAIPEGDAERNVIRVSTRAEEGRVLLSVSDTGTGIAPDVLPRIFEPFFTTKPLGVGTGLGLAICHGIVRALGGEIDVKSAPLQGSTFTVSLPALPPEVDSQSRISLLPPPSVARYRVLVVDDEPAIARALQRIVGQRHTVDVAVGGLAALDALDADAVRDVVFCDLMMPDMTGMDLHERIASRWPHLTERVVFMTAGAFTPRARDFLDRVPNARIAKPFRARAVLEVIDRIGRLARAGSR